MWIKSNLNPLQRNVEDCQVRALAEAIGVDWDTAHEMLCDASRGMATMPHDNDVLMAILRQYGFKRAVVPNLCPDCYSVAEFCRDNPVGTFVIMTGNHVLTAKDGDWIDSWDSGRETANFYYYKNGGN